MTTEDGYILSLWRIYSKESTGKFKKSILISHGLLDNSFTFLARGKNESLPFILASHNYNVWLMNNRGNIFSSGHKDSNKTAENIFSDYWDFTFEEFAKYDLFSCLNYIRNFDNTHEKIGYICHSQGCFQFLIGFTLMPDYMEQNVDKFATMGAVLKVQNFVN